MADDNDQFDDVTFKEFLGEILNDDGFTEEEWEQKLSDEEEMKHRAVKPKKRKKKDRKKLYEARGGGMIGSNKIIKGYKKGGQV